MTIIECKNSISPIGMQIVTHFRNTIKRTMLLVDKELESVGDIGDLIALPKNCSIKQLAVFHDDRNNFEVDKSLWSKLNSLNRIALLVHEIEWRNTRRFNEKTSYSTRTYVGAVFSIENVARVKKMEFPKGTIFCQAGVRVILNTDGTITKMSYSTETSMAFFKDEANSKKMRIHFLSFFGRNMSSIIQLELPNVVKMESMVFEGMEYGENQVNIIDPLASLNEIFEPIAMTPSAYQVRLNYSYGDVFTIELLDHNNIVLEKLPIAHCMTR